MSLLTIALVTARAARNLDEDLVPLEHALRDAGADVLVVGWDDSDIVWANFKFVLLRSTWDYTQRLPEFLAWAERIAAITQLLNPLPIVRWNTDKHYLATLASRGVPIVPSQFIEPGENVSATLATFLTTNVADSDFVIKPAIGAGSRDAQRYLPQEREAAIIHAQRLLHAGRSVLLQPYLSSVDQLGETALIFFAGRFSHAIRKGPLLKRGAESTRALFATEHISPRVPDADEQQVAEQALAAIPMTGCLLYARVDIIRDRDGKPRVLELELTEPSLFFAQASGAVERLVAAILALP